ncbi:MAG: hypothetical protein K940chlam9_01167 [Chlamydiae bacterium]|nr:hypothetical protein [Chlamydiota bacterium]
MAEKTTEKISLDDRVIHLFEGNMRRIFAMKVTRSTYREIQNTILSCANQNQDLANFLFETLMTGQIKVSIPNEKHREIIEEVIQNFTIPARLAKEVFERGEFINIITSDLVTQEEKVAFYNRLRRIDGEEFHFLSDAQNTMHLLQHFSGRMVELDNHPKGREEIEKFKKELGIIGDRLKQLSL